MKLDDLTGRTFGRLVVIERSGGPSKKHTYWLCGCECGNLCIVASAHLKSGHTKSCGCLASIKKQDEATLRMKKIYRGMRSRCYNHKVGGYKYYGGRGITVCDEWLNDFQAFYDWSVTNGYNNNLTLDRIDNDGNYEPSNCRWVTMLEQSNNTRANVFITYKGKTKTIAEWARELDIHVHTLSNRLDRGWSVEDAFERPVQKKRKK